jgi:hypothetical protein
MAWKQIAEQIVVAHLGGKVRPVLVIAWESHTGAIRVAWPPQNPAIEAPNPYSHVGKTRIEKVDYEPLDPDGFRVATSG